MLLVKSAHEEHTCDGHYMLNVILDCPYKNLLYTNVTFEGHMGMLPLSIRLPFSCTISYCVRSVTRTPLVANSVC